MGLRCRNREISVQNGAPAQQCDGCDHEPDQERHDRNECDGSQQDHGHAQPKDREFPAEYTGGPCQQAQVSHGEGRHQHPRNPDHGTNQKPSGATRVSVQAALRLRTLPEDDPAPSLPHRNRDVLMEPKGATNLLGLLGAATSRLWSARGGDRVVRCGANVATDLEGVEIVRPDLLGLPDDGRQVIVDRQVAAGEGVGPPRG